MGRERGRGGDDTVLVREIGSQRAAVRDRQSEIGSQRSGDASDARCKRIEGCDGDHHQLVVVSILGKDPQIYCQFDHEFCHTVFVDVRIDGVRTGRWCNKEEGRRRRRRGRSHFSRS